MPINNKVKQLYDALKADNGDVGTPEEFNKWFFKPGKEGYLNRKSVYDIFKKDGADVGNSYEEFRDWLGLHQVQKNTPTVDKYRKQLFTSVNPTTNAAASFTKNVVNKAKKATNVERKPIVQTVIDQNGKKIAEYPISIAKTVEDLDREYAQQETRQWENELDEQKKDAEKENSVINNLMHSFIQDTDEVGSVWGNIGRGGGMASVPHSVTTNNGLYEKEDMRRLQAAANYNRERRKLLDLEIESKKGATFDNKSFFRGLYDAATDPNLLTSGHSGMIDAFTTLGVAQELGKGKHTKSGDILLNALVKKNEAQSKYEDENGWMYNGGVITANMAPFIAQIASAGFSGAASKEAGELVQGAATKVAQGVMKKTAGIVGTNVAKSIGKFTGLSTKAFGKTLQYGIIGAAQANTTGMQNVMTNVAQNNTGEAYRDEHGNVKFGTFDSNGNLVHDGGEDFMSALVHGELSQTIEFATELAGGGIDAVGGSIKRYLGEGTKKLIEKYNMKNVSNVIDFLLNNKLSKNIRYIKDGTEKTLGKLELNSIVGESMEEELGIVANAILTGDNQLSDLFDEKQQTDIWGGMLLSMGFMHGLSMPFHANKARKYYQYKHKVDKADANCEQLLGSDKWAELRDKIDATTNEEMPNLVKEINRDVALGKNRQAVREYCQNLLKMRGYDLGNMLAAKNAIDNKGKDVSAKSMEMNQAYGQGYDAQDADTHEIQLDQSDKAKTLAEKLGITEQQLSAMSDEELDSLTGKDDDLDTKIYEYQVSNARYEGVMDNANDKVDLAAQQASQQVDMQTDKSRGTVRNATIKATDGANDYGVYIVSGNIATNEDGSINVHDSDSMILYYDPTTGTIEHADASRFAELGEEQNAEGVKDNAVAEAKEKTIKEISGIIDGVVTEGTSFTTTDEEGNETVYEVLADNGDGTFMVTINGNVDTQPHSLEELQQLKDIEDQKRLEEAKAQRAQLEEERKQQQEEEDKNVPGNIDYSEITNDDGNVVMVDVLDENGNTRFPNSQLFLVSESGAKAKVMEMDADGRLKPHAVNKGDIQRIGTLTLDEYKETVKDAEKPMPKEEPEAKLEQPKPVGKSLFGNVYDAFKGKAKEAFNYLFTHKEGDLQGVFHRKDVGDIDLVWGDRTKNQGLDHIIDKHIERNNDFDSLEEAAQVIDDVINNGEVNEKKSKWNKVVLEKDGYMVIISKNVRGKDGNIIDNNKNWVVTAFDSERGKGNKKRIPSDVTPVTPNTNEGSRAVAPDGSPFSGKDTNNSTNDNGNNATLTFEDGSAVPLLEDGNPDFSQMSAQQSAELYDDTLGEDASQVIGDNVAAAKKALDKANGMKVKGNSFLEQKASKEAKERAIKEAQEKYDSAKAISEAYEERQLNKNLETHDGRMSLLDKAKAKYARLKGKEEWKEKANELWNETVGKALHRLYDGLSVNVFDTEPQTIEEYVSGSLVPFSLNYEGNENGKGVKQETGLERKDFAKSRVLAAEGKGKTMDKLVHELWENRPSQFESYTDQDIRDAVIGLITSDMNSYDMRHVIENNRIAQAEKEIEDEKMGHENAQYQEEQQLAEQGQLSAEQGQQPTERQDEGSSENANLPFGEQLDESAVPFSVNGERTGKEYDINDADDRKRLIAENSVEDKDILEIDMPKHVHNAIKAIAKKMGLKVQFLYMGSSANGWIENGTIYLCLDAERAMQFVFGHEMTHAIKQANPSAYRELVKVAASIMTDEEWDKQVAANLAKYRGMAGYNTADDIVEEVVADALGKFVDDFDLAKRFALKLSHPVLASVIQAIRDIKNLVLGAPYRQLESLEKIVENAYVDAARGTLEASTSGNRMSLKNKEEVKEANDRFNSEIEGFKNKTHKGLMHLGKPSPILKACGVDVDEITLSPKVLNRKLNQHSLSTDDVKDLVNAIQKPIMVYQHGKTRPNIVVITDTEIRGNKLSVALELDEDGNVTELNNVSSVHDKNADKEVERWLSWDEGYFENALRWVDKEKVSDWLSSARLISYSQTENNQKLSSLANVLNSFENPKVSEENLQKSEEKVSAMPKTLEEFLASPKLKFSIKTEAERKAAQKAYDYAMSLRPDKWKQYALVNMKNPNQAPAYYEKKEFADKWRVYANRIWKDNTDFKLFDLDKPFEEQVMNVKGKVPTEFEPQKSKEKEGIAHRQKLRREMDIADATIDRLNRKSREDFNDFIEKYAAEHGLANKYDVPYEVWQEAQHDISAKYDAQKDALLEKLNSLKEEMQNVAAKFSLQDGKTLVGVHNISEDKLRKAIKQGGLANPSVAVIDMSKQAHEGYGEISLIMPSAKIAKKTGRNAGTWQGDAWTPTYPQVERQMDSKGSAKASEDVLSVPREMQGKVRMGMNAWLDNGNDTSGMAYLFLHERSEAPEMKTTPSKYSEDTYNELRHITAGGFNLFGIGKADTEKVIDLYVKEKYGGDRAAYEDGLRNWVEKNKKAAAEDKNGLRKAIAIQNLDVYGEHGFNFKGVQSFVRDVEYDHRKGGKADIDGAMRASDEYVKSQGLQEEFNKWLEGKEKQYGIKEVIFDGFTPSGKRRYVDNTLENVSKLMKRQGRNGSSGLGFSFNNFAAKLMNSYGKLSDIRSKKNLLTSNHEDLDKFREKWGEVFFELGKKCQPDAENPFDDYGMERLSEAALQKDPQAYLKKEYNVDFSDADLEKLNDMIKAIKEEYPAMYFETKFERPVGLEEFKAAVVPSTLANGVKESLQEAGLPLYEYDRTKEGDRKRAFEDAIGASDDVRFSINTYHGSGADFDHFDHSHMGEGEGSQSFGWGTYVTSSKKIGRNYAELGGEKKKKEFVYDGKEIDIEHLAAQLEDIVGIDNKSILLNYLWYADRNGIASAKEKLKADIKVIENIRNHSSNPSYYDAEIYGLRKFYDLKGIQKNTKKTRNLYEVEIPDDTGENYLEWDKELTTQQKGVISKAIKKLKIDLSSYGKRGFSLDGTGEDMYHFLSYVLRHTKKWEDENAQRAVSKFLSSLGFTGIKYPAGTIMGDAEKGDTNYVIFNEGDAKIVEHTRFSLKDTNDKFNSDLDAYIKDGVLPKNNRFDLGMPSKVLLDSGFPSLPISMRVSLLNKKAGMERHPFAPSDLHDMVKAVHNPIAVFEYTKPNMRNLIIDLSKNGKHFLVGVTLDYRKGEVAVNSISGLFPKENHEWIKWIQDGKAIQIGQKEKVLSLINSLRTNPEEAERIGLNLDSAAKIVKGFDNSKENAEKFSLKDSKEQDEEYMKAVEDGDMEKAQAMVNEAAKRAGYSAPSDYQGTSAFNGAAPWGNSYFLTREERKEAWDNDDFDGDSSLGDYIKDGIDGGNLEVLTNSASFRSADSMRKKAILNVRNAINSKAKTIKMYRSVPASVKEGSFRNGDWITPSKDYAKDNAALHGWGNDYRIIEQEVPVDDVWFDGNDIAEWGYGREEDYAKGTDFAYKNTENNKKLLEPVTYDDEGKVIPLSKRFDEKKSDVRFSLQTFGTDIVNASDEIKKLMNNEKNITRRIGSRAQAQNRVFDTLSRASDEYRRANQASARSGQDTWEKDRALGYVVRASYRTGAFLTEEEIKEITDEKVGHGEENQVYRSKDRNTVIKLNNLLMVDKEFRFNEFIDRINAHNEFAPEDIYVPIGFAFNEYGDFCIVLEQPYVDGIPALQAEIDEYLDSHGFYNCPIKMGYGDVEIGWSNGKFDLWDAKSRNVLKDKKGDLHFIDTVIQHTFIDGQNDKLRFSLRYDDYENQLEQWKKDNGLPKDAQRPTLPIRNAGESATDYMARVQRYRKEMALWKTAPTYETHLLDSDKAQGIYNRELQRGSVLRRIAVQDSMLAIRKAQEAIMREHGAAINMAEDAYMAENRSHGKGKNELEEYYDEYMKPLRKAYNDMMKALGKSYDNVKVYMMAKHGLERNAHMAFNKALEHDYKEQKDRIDAYNRYKSDLNRVLNDANYKAGKIDFTTWRQKDNAIRMKYAPSYMEYRYDKMGITQDYAGLSALFDGSSFEEDAAALVKDVEDKHSILAMNLWDATNDATKKILKNSYDAGFMSNEVYEYIRNMYSNYIPLRGWSGTQADQVWDYIGGGKGAFNQTLKDAHGRSSIADDPMAYIENMAESGIIINNKNWVKQHLLLLAQNRPTSLLSVSKAWYIKTLDSNGNEVWEPASPGITADMSSKKVKDALDKFEKRMEQLEQKGDATQKRGHLDIEYPKTNSETREHEVRVMKDGEEYVIYVNGDPQLAQAMNNSRAYRVRERLADSKFDKGCELLGRGMATLYTSLSPLFIPANYTRDLTMTLASTAVREDARYNHLLRKNMLTSWGTMKYVLEYQNGTLREKVRNKKASKTEEKFYDYMMNGGETGFVTSVDVDDLKKKFKNELKDMNRFAANPKKVGHIIMDSIETLNRAIEDSNRFMVYKTSIEYGRSIEEAVNDAKDVTLNFNRKGTGEGGWQQFRNLYLFVNPAIQSLQTMGALAKKHPIKFTAVTTLWMASGMLVPAVNNLALNMFGGDDDKDKYWSFSKWDRRNNFIMWVPFTNQFVKIPLAQEFRGFYAVGDIIASMMNDTGKARETWEEYAEDMVGQVVDMLPLDPTGYDGNLAVSLMPNAIRPLFELAFNVDFTGKPLFRDTDYNKYDPNFTKAYVGTPDWLVRLSKMVNSVGNDYPDVQQNAIDRIGNPRYNLNNPAVVDHILSSYLGGSYTVGSQILGLATKSLNSDSEIKFADIPIMSRFVVNPNDRPISKKQGDEFWNMKDEHDRIGNTLSKLKKKAKEDGDYSELERFYSSKEYAQYKAEIPRVKQYEDDKKKEKSENSGEEYVPRKTNGNDVYNRHTTAHDDFEDAKMSQLYTKMNSYRLHYNVLKSSASVSVAEEYYKNNRAAIDASEKVADIRNEIAKLKSSFIDDGKENYNADEMKEIRKLRKEALSILESAR